MANCYEGVGVPPDIEINYPMDQNLFIQDLEIQLETGDEAIEKVYQMMGTK